MNIMVLGATGFVGTHLIRKLLDQGHQIVAVARQPELAKSLFPSASIIECDFNVPQSIEEWFPRLNNIDVIINCIGIFYHRDASIIWQVHFNSPRIIFETAAKTNVKRIIQISALGIENYDTEYAKSKLELDNFLLQLPIQSIILRPSFIYGPGAEGGMELFTTVSSFPLIFLPGKGEQQLQPIHIDKLCAAISNLCERSLKHSMILTAASSDALSIKAILKCLRKWLNLPKTVCLPVPITFIRIAAWFGNLSSSSKLNSAALSMLGSSNTATKADTDAFYQISDVSPESFEEEIFKTSSTRADLLQARLGWLRPLLRISLVFMWLASAVTSAFFARETSYMLLTQAGLDSFWHPVLLYGASTVNLMIAISLLFNYRTKLNCIVQLIVILIYTLIISVQLPNFWLEPFGSIVKNIPVAVSILMLYFTEPVSASLRRRSNSWIA
ncbi:oxidoreductase [Legionella birminghamensis]|uniref:Oxidoreductase n=1 Tax=Legionella birminghamensis TaxID=28083 RepID=A0A378I9N8_9GAMM|nr:SDR family oxidoreductase [Legionella birminghamensis]KTC74657.1 oxidoreductase [Legionella birminghamensis]STX31460.1 oxidoreductase [Legionella birminghamensis]